MKKKANEIAEKLINSLFKINVGLDRSLISQYIDCLRSRWNEEQEYQKRNSETKELKNKNFDNQNDLIIKQRETIINGGNLLDLMAS